MKRAAEEFENYIQNTKRKCRGGRGDAGRRRSLEFARILSNWGIPRWLRFLGGGRGEFVWGEGPPGGWVGARPLFTKPNNGSNSRGGGKIRTTKRVFMEYTNNITITKTNITTTTKPQPKTTRSRGHAHSAMHRRALLRRSSSSRTCGRRSRRAPPTTCVLQSGWRGTRRPPTGLRV